MRKKYRGRGADKFVMELVDVNFQLSQLEKKKQQLTEILVEILSQNNTRSARIGGYIVTVAKPVVDEFDVEGLREALVKHGYNIEGLFTYSVNRQNLFRDLDSGVIPRELVSRYWKVQPKRPYVRISLAK